MTSYVPPKKNDSNGYVFYVSLSPRVPTGAFQASPTLAAGDVKIAIDDGAPANLNTLPAVDADFTKRVKVVLSQAETNGDNLSIIFSDAAGAEWCDLMVNLQTAARGIDDLAFPTVSGRSLDVTATGAAGVDWGNVENPTTTVGLSGTTVKTATDVEADTADIQSRLPAALISGRMDVTVGAMQNNVLTSSVTASNFLTELADAVHDEVVDGTTTFRESTRLHNAALGGKASGLDGATAIYRDLADTKNRISASVDGSGNRTAVTRDLT